MDASGNSFRSVWIYRFEILFIYCVAKNFTIKLLLKDLRPVPTMGTHVSKSVIVNNYICIHIIGYGIFTFHSFLLDPLLIRSFVSSGAYGTP